MGTYDIERAVIASFLYSDMSNLDVSRYELREEWFSDFNNKLVVHAINHLTATGFYDEITVKEYLERDMRFNISAFENVMTSNIAGSQRTLNAWIDVLKKSEAVKHMEV